MKRIVCLLSVVLFVSSCTNEFSIVKRKYSSGFYISKSEGVEKKTVVPQKIDEIDLSQKLQSSENQPMVSAASTQVNTTSLKTVSIKKQQNVAEKISSCVNRTVSKVASSVPLKKIKKGLSNTVHPTVESNQVSKEKTILLVILCFLWWLNLLAVYIHDSGITLNFWVTLLLDFTLVGGIIFSLLVVLDVIDLA